MKKDILLQCQHLSERFPRERLGILIPVLHLYPLATLLYILVALALPFAFVLQTTSQPQIGRMVVFFVFLFYFTWIITMSLPLVSPIISSPPSVSFLPQTAPLSVVWISNTLHIPPTLSCSHCLFPFAGNQRSRVTPEHCSLQLSSNTSINNVNVFIFSKRIWFP